MTDEHGEHTVIFETPWHRRVWGSLSVALAALIFFLPGAMWALAGFGLWSLPPWWWHVIGLALLAGGATLVTRHSREALARRLVVDERGWRLDGLRTGIMIPYEQVKLLQLDNDHRSLGVGNVRKLVIELRRGDKRSIWLRDRDARECLDAMHELCRAAIAINPEGETRLPVDEQMHVLAHLTLAKRYRRRGWLALLGSALMLALAAARAWSWLTSAGPPRSTVAFLISSGIHLMCSIGLMVFAIGLFRAARAHTPTFTVVSSDELDDDEIDMTDE